MAQRLDLQKLLIELLGSSNVYFQPPSTLVMQYPCIVYNRSSENVNFADNIPYKHKKRYQLTVIDVDPDSDIPSKVGNLPTCSFERFFALDNLNHDVYNLFF
jgi:hypothetical protein